MTSTGVSATSRAPFAFLSGPFFRFAQRLSTKLSTICAKRSQSDILARRQFSRDVDIRSVNLGVTPDRTPPAYPLNMPAQLAFGHFFGECTAFIHKFAACQETGKNSSKFFLRLEHSANPLI